MPPSAPFQTQRLTPITSGTRDDYVLRHDEAVGAVGTIERHLGQIAAWYGCVKHALATGEAATGC